MLLFTVCTSLPPNALQASSMFTLSAQYICLAFVLQQHKSVYRQSLNVVKQVGIQRASLSIFSMAPISQCAASETGMEQ